MTEMVEKVARAICKEQGALPAYYPAYYPAARVAISVLMKPTEEMYGAGQRVIDHGNGDASAVLLAMLKAALND